jgi:hypothetical protein
MKRYKKELLKNRGHQCEVCLRKKWRGRDIPLEVHHVDGDPMSNDLTNLKLLCANCHAQTDNYRGKNKTRYKDITDDIIIDMIPKSFSASDCLRKLGVRPQKHYIDRVKKLQGQNLLSFLNRFKDSSSVGLQKCEKCDAPTFDAKKTGLCAKCYSIKQRRVERPSKQTLKELLSDMSWVAIGKKYGVSDNAIRKWAKNYDII